MAHRTEFGVVAGTRGTVPSAGSGGGVGPRLMRVPFLQYAGISASDCIDSEVSVPLGSGPLPGACSLSSARGSSVAAWGGLYWDLLWGPWAQSVSELYVPPLYPTVKAWGGSGRRQRHVL